MCKDQKVKLHTEVGTQSKRRAVSLAFDDLTASAGMQSVNMDENELNY